MIFRTLNFPSILPENERTYLQYLGGIIESVDKDANVLVTKTILGISVRISPSSPRFFDSLLVITKKFHSALDMRVEFSKSMKAGQNIFFNINF